MKVFTLSLLCIVLFVAFTAANTAEKGWYFHSYEIFEVLLLRSCILSNLQTSCAINFRFEISYIVFVI